MEYTAFVVDLVVCEAREQEAQEEQEQRKQEQGQGKTVYFDEKRLLAVVKVMKLIKRQNKRFVL